MKKLRYWILVLGAGISLWGLSDLRISSNASQEPIEVDLAELERGADVPGNHIRLGEHLAIFETAVYDLSSGDAGTPGRGDEAGLSEVYYPIISPRHRFARRLNLGEKTSLAEIPLNQMKTLDDFRVVVKTDQYPTVGSIPSGAAQMPELRGMVVNSIGGMNYEQENIWRRRYPGIDFESILVIEPGREPGSAVRSILAMVVGFLVLVLGIFLFLLEKEHEG
ncbi:MAG: hypothetical protein AAFU85_09625 [Planctomycetota bacterium]